LSGKLSGSAKASQGKEADLSRDNSEKSGAGTPKFGSDAGGDAPPNMGITIKGVEERLDAKELSNTSISSIN
jgi:hypothetical protein